MENGATPPIMQIGSDDYSPKPANRGENTRIKQLKNERRSAYKRYITWIAGMLISFIPLITLPLYQVLTGKLTGCMEVMDAIFVNSSIVFLAISLVVATINEAEEGMENILYQVWKWIAFIVLIFAAVLFGLVSIIEKENTVGTPEILITINTVLFLLTVFGCSIPYILAIVRAHKKVKEATK